MDSKQPAPPDKRTVQFWQSIRAGDAISLSDEATLMARMAAGKGPTPEQFEVREVLEIVPRSKICTWRFFALDMRRHLLAKIVDDMVELHAYVEAADWEPLTRKEMLDRDMRIFFQAPPDPDNFKLENLKYSLEIPHEIGDKTFVYSQKPQGELHGEAFFHPGKSGLEHPIATVVEYQINEKGVEPEMMILEIGTKTNGLVKLLTGRPLLPNDVDVVSKR